MSGDGEAGDREAAKARRRGALAGLGSAVRRLADAAVSTALEPDEIEPIQRRVEALTRELARAHHDGPYSGLLPRERDYRRPGAAMPLSPILGECSPVRPDVEMTLDGERVTGRAVLGKKWVGPPGYAHGGVTALLCDQLVALAARAGGVRGVTRALEVRYHRPTPLHEPLELAGWCERVEGQEVRARCEIRAGEKVCVSASAELVYAPRIAESKERRAAPPVELERER